VVTRAEIEADQVIETADHTLHRAKDSGHNAVIRASEVNSDESLAATIARSRA
jgi:hypothetical protein